MLDEGLIDFWKRLSENGVAYIMVGGFAVMMHGFVRATQHLDIWIRDDAVNRGKLGQAMIAYGYNESTWKDLEFIPEWTNFHIGEGLELDILTSLKGFEMFSFDDCFRFATIAIIQQTQVPFLHINHLIANKKASNRPKDQLDVLELEKIKALRQQMNLD